MEKEVDWFENLSVSNKKNIPDGIDDLENGPKHNHEDVTAFAQKK
jgi:hypothetical protein